MFMYRIIMIGIPLFVSVPAVMGATVASLNFHPYWYASRICALLTGVMLVALNIFSTRNTGSLFKHSIIATIVGLLIAFATLPILSNYNPLLVSNRSYGHLLGTVLIIFVVFGMAMLFSKVKHLTRPFSGHSR